MKRSSWLLIAHGLHVRRISAILLSRLAAARSRQDALRVLRIARKCVQVRKSAQSARHGKIDPENLVAVAEDTSPARYDEYEMELRWQEDFELEVWGHPTADYEEWLQEAAQCRQFARTRIPGLSAVSGLQEVIDRYAWEHLPVPQLPTESLRNRLDHATYQNLVRIAPDVQPAVELTEDQMAYLRRHHLADLLGYVENPSQAAGKMLIQDGWALAGLRMIEDHTGHPVEGAQVNWSAVLTWLTDHLLLPAEPDRNIPIIVAAYALFHEAPVEFVLELLRTSGNWTGAWKSLIGYAYQRIDELLPEIRVNRSKLNQDGMWLLDISHIREIQWERVLDAASGSSLTLHQLATNLEDLFVERVDIPDAYWNQARHLLLAGGATLRRMDYPAFDLVCRPTLSQMRLETFSGLVEAARELCEMHRQFLRLDRERWAEWISRMYADLHAASLPRRVSQKIASVLERHAIAYLMLKERVLREEMRAAPFRLRNRHIERFWVEQESGESQVSTPVDLAALREQFDFERVQEALAHALMDHFKDHWEEEPAVEPSHPLKETLLTLLRCVAITYRLRAPWLPYNELGEEDLDHSVEVANFLIQQTANAPTEMAQALLLAPHQGLPLLNGGQTTPLERRCRRLIREAAGVSQKKMSEGVARVFSCQPLSKVAALDRGSLAGDCSSASVPLRALSPHHVHYGIFENGVQQRGYITVYEAWAQEIGKDERLPRLCLETINVPIPVFLAGQQDLLVIFEAVARRRGLADGLVLITGIHTWNYQNGEVLRQCRRFRQGKAVRIIPADPVSWNVYHLLASEAEAYTAFFDDENAQRYSDSFRILAPYQPDQDGIEPENLAEAQRIAEIAQREILVTARTESGPIGFISNLPKIT